MLRLRCRDGGVSTTGLLIIIFIIFALIAAGAYIITRPEEEEPTPPQQLVFTSDRDEPGNWDIYMMDLSTGTISRLTDAPSIDHHPDLSPDGSRIVFSSTRGAGVDFDLYVADVSDVDGTAIRLTYDSYPNGPQTHYPDRHPHFSHDGSLIVFDSKNRPLSHPIELASECSVPKIITPPRFYEGLNVIKIDPAGILVDYVELDIRDAWDRDAYPDIWRDDNAAYIGHPSFSPDGSKITFSAAIDGDGTDWEVYTVGFNNSTLSLVPNSLRRITNGSLYPPNPNPIQMSGGAHFSADGSIIIFSSTRTTQGNSQLFWAYADEADVPVQESRRLTSHLANDYVPEPLDDGRVVFVSDRGTPSMCPLPPDVEGPTMDLDLFIMNADGSAQTNLTGNDAADEMLLIADEVSWFCGLKPNLASCTYRPRIFNTEALWLMRYSYELISPDLLERFNIPDARPLYNTYWSNLDEYVMTQPHLQDLWPEILTHTEILMYTFPGFQNETALEEWMTETAQIRDQLFVLPSIMHEDGIGKLPEVVGEVHSLSILAESPVAAGDTSSITVEAKDAEGNPVPGADISLLWDIPGARDEWGVPLALVDQGDGSYTSSLTSQWAGTYTLITSTNTDVVATNQVSFEPGPPAGVVISSTSPKPVPPYYVSALTFYAVDAHGNIISGDDTFWSIISSFGQVGELQANPDDTFSIDILADNWGTAEVTITDEVSGVSGSENIEFMPTYLDLSYDLVEPTVEIIAAENLEFFSSGDKQTLSLDIGIFFPLSLGTLGQYDLRVEYDNSILELVDITDPDPTDNFEAPEWTTSDNIIYLNQIGSATEPGVSVATILFEPWGWVENLWENLKKKAGKIITWVENLWDDLTRPVETPPGHVRVDGKVFKKLFIPLKIWIVDGSGVSDDAARSDAERAEDTLNKNAKACRLKYWYVFLVEINHISEGEWGTKAGADGQLTNDERDNLSRQNRWGRWINVYYVPDNALGGALGLWDRSENAIFIDDNADFDNRTLAHELIHELSKSKVKDSPVDNAAAQGGRDDNNIMNYDNTGDDISEEQGRLIEEEVDNRADERPAGEGGGSIYKPNPYRVEPTLGRVHVAGIETGFEHFEGYSYAKAWVTVEDSEGNPVAGATVISEVDRPDDTTATESEITGPDGVALLSHYTTFYGNYTFTVTDIRVEGMEYDPTANVVSSASVTLE